MDIFQLPLFFVILIFSQLTVIITTIFFCGKLLKPKKNDKQMTESMASKGSVGPDGKIIAGGASQQAPGAAGATPDGKKPDDAASAAKKPDDKKPDDKKKDGAASKKNDLDQSKGKQSKEDDGGGEGYENCNEMSPSQLQKIANEVK